MMFPIELGEHPESPAEEDTNTAREEEAGTNGELAKNADESNAETGKIDVRVEGTQEGLAEQPRQGDDTLADSTRLDSTTATGAKGEVEHLQQQQIEPQAASLDGNSRERQRDEAWQSLILEWAQVEVVVEGVLADFAKKVTTFGSRF